MSTPIQLCDEAIRLLDDALGRPPTELEAEVDVAERAVARLRDSLILRCRASPTADVRASLERVNQALSLIVGVEYPVGGIQRPMLEQARAALAAAQPSLAQHT